MKGWGITCIVLGILSLMGCLLKGNSATGPLFWIGLGIYLVHRANQKKQEQEQSQSNSNTDKVEL